MIVVTGGAGFIGSNLVRRLNDEGCCDVIVVDDLTDSTKIQNIQTCRIADYMDKGEFLDRVERRKVPVPEAIFHQGACSNTMEADGKFMMESNYNYSKVLLEYALEQYIPFIYASSASVYGDGEAFSVDIGNEKALNAYAYSKLQFDNYVRRCLERRAESQVVGLRYFNVYGAGEAHKGNMASVIYHFHGQYLENGYMNLFSGSDGYADGDQERDFVWVGDIASANLYFLTHPETSGIFNVGTGNSRSFNDVALAVIHAVDGGAGTLQQAVTEGKIRYIPFPDALVGKYQSYTRADIQGLREIGYISEFADIEEGVMKYVQHLSGNR